MRRMVHQEAPTGSGGVRVQPHRTPCSRRTRAATGCIACRVLGALRDAAACAAKVEDWRMAAHCHHLAALVWDACGCVGERNAEAAECLRLQQLGPEGFCQV